MLAFSNAFFKFYCAYLEFFVHLLTQAFCWKDNVRQTSMDHASHASPTGTVAPLCSREFQVLVALGVRRFVHDAVMRYTREHYRRRRRMLTEGDHQSCNKNMSRRLIISGRREWFSPKDIEDVYGVSRTTLWRILKDAQEKGLRIDVTELDFRNGAAGSRKRPFIRISKESFDRYLLAHANH